MDKEALYKRIQTMIISSTNKPKHVALSSVKLAQLFGAKPIEVEKYIEEFVAEGRLKKSKLKEPPHSNIYLLP